MLFFMKFCCFQRSFRGWFCALVKAINIIVHYVKTFMVILRVEKQCLISRQWKSFALLAIFKLIWQNNGNAGDLHFWRVNKVASRHLIIRRQQVNIQNGQSNQSWNSTCCRTYL